MLTIVILAAGQGKRMCSTRPKVLHLLAGQPLLQHVLAVAKTMTQSIYTVVGHGADEVQALLQDTSTVVEQAEQLGTGHAVLQALPLIESHHRVLVLYGDVPLVRQETLQRLLDQTPAEGLGLLTVNLSDPSGYGRIIRNGAGQVVRVVEHKDATEKERALTEINTGILCVPAQRLKAWLPHLSNTNTQKEYYLTDIVKMAMEEGCPIHAEQPAYPEEVAGVNDRLQLAALERFYQRQQAEALMEAGVTLLDPARLDIRGTCAIESDVTLDVNVILEGHVTIGTGTVVGPHVVLKDATVGHNVRILAHSVIEGADIGDDCVVGPFARLRPGTVLAKGAHVGNFVEIKNTSVGEGSKANHLTYLGDAEIGARVNVGAGTITCNYDGANKHKTVIEDDVFIGSDTQLVAPVKVGKGATLGAGTTLTEDAPENALTISRMRQKSITGWQRPKK